MEKLLRWVCQVTWNFVEFAEDGAWNTVTHFWSWNVHLRWEYFCKGIYFDANTTNPKLSNSNSPSVTILSSSGLKMASRGSSWTAFWPRPPLSVVSEEVKMGSLATELMSRQAEKAAAAVSVISRRKRSSTWCYWKEKRKQSVFRRRRRNCIIE